MRGGDFKNEFWNFDLKFYFKYSHSDIWLRNLVIHIQKPNFRYTTFEFFKGWCVGGGDFKNDFWELDLDFILSIHIQIFD